MAKRACPDSIHSSYVKMESNDRDRLFYTKQHIHQNIEWTENTETEDIQRLPGREGGLWEEGTVYYTIDIKDVELKSMVQQAINTFNNQISNLQWVHRKSKTEADDMPFILPNYYLSLIQNRSVPSTRNDYVSFIRNDLKNPHSKCFGRIGGEQIISLCRKFPGTGGKIGVGTILHEMGHAIGLSHTHQMPNRSDFVDVISLDSDSSFKFNFKEKAQWGFGTYDPGSIMHYACGKYKHGIIKARDSKLAEKMGQSKCYSANDIKIINGLYQFTKRSMAECSPLKRAEIAAQILDPNCAKIIRNNAYYAGLLRRDPTLIKKLNDEYLKRIGYWYILSWCVLL